MKVGITGGSGFIGRYLVESLAEGEAYEPIVFSRNDSEVNMDWECRRTDYSKDDLKTKLKDVDFLVHLAGIRSIGKNYNAFDNVRITDNIYKSCIAASVSSVVFASSISVYSDMTSLPWKETDVLSPRTYYGVSKIACENIGDVLHRSYGINIKSLRISHVMGEEERKGFMMNTFLDSAYKKELLQVLGKSVAKRDFVYVKDVVTALKLALGRVDDHDVFNIGSGRALTNLQIAEEINIGFGNEGNLIYNNEMDEGIKSSYMNIDKARRILGFEPKYSMRDSIKDIKKIKSAIK